MVFCTVITIIPSLVFMVYFPIKIYQKEEQRTQKNKFIINDMYLYCCLEDIDR